MGNELTYDERWNGAKIHKKQWHFHRRLFERYKIVMDVGEYSNMMKLIQDQKAIKIGRTKNGIIYGFRIKSTHKRFAILVNKHNLPITAWPWRKTLHNNWEYQEKKFINKKRQWDKRILC